MEILPIDKVPNWLKNYEIYVNAIERGDDHIIIPSDMYEENIIVEDLEGFIKIHISKVPDWLKNSEFVLRTIERGDYYIIIPSDMYNEDLNIEYPEEFIKTLKIMYFWGVFEYPEELVEYLNNNISDLFLTITCLNFINKIIIFDLLINIKRINNILEFESILKSFIKHNLLDIVPEEYSKLIFTNLIEFMNKEMEDSVYFLTLYRYNSTLKIFVESVYNDLIINNAKDADLFYELKEFYDIKDYTESFYEFCWKNREEVVKYSKSPDFSILRNLSELYLFIEVTKIISKNEVDSIRIEISTRNIFNHIIFRTNDLYIKNISKNILQKLEELKNFNFEKIGSLEIIFSKEISLSFFFDPKYFIINLVLNHNSNSTELNYSKYNFHLFQKTQEYINGIFIE